jgi:hypothetical protein
MTRLNGFQDRRIQPLCHPSGNATQANAHEVRPVPAPPWPVVFVARLICSDPDCRAELTGEAGRVGELESLLCECGCALELIGWPDWVDEPAQVVPLRVAAARLRRAA